MGALYAAAMPDAAPQPTSNRSRYGGHFASCPHLDASVAESSTMPPSRPMEPPEPMLTSDDRNFTRPERSGSLPSPATTTSRIFVVRCGPDSFNPKYRTNPAINPPSVGVSSRPQ